MKSAASKARHVFLNVPYDPDFVPLFLAYIAGLATLGLPHSVPIPQFLRDFIDPKVNLWEAALALVVAAPLTEEALFRGVILRGFLTRHSVTTSIAVSAVMFGAVHGNLWQLLPAIGFGFMAGWWRVRSGSLIPAVYAHALGKGFPLVAGRVFH